MSEELGKVEKPPVEKFAGQRKLIVVPLLFSGNNAPEEFLKIYKRCWTQITEQVRNLETKLGGIARIYHEMIFADGEEGMKILEQLNPESHQIVKAKVENGAQLKAVEDMELATEHMDWERCLMVAMGEKVRRKLAEFHAETSAKRYEHISRKIDENLGEGEVGVYLVREGHRTQFPQDIEVFNVYPPALDELNRWLRDYSNRTNQANTQKPND